MPMPFSLLEQNSDNMMEDDGRGSNVPSSSGPEPPRTIQCSMQDTGPIVQELTLSSIPDRAHTRRLNVSRLGLMSQHNLVRLPSESCFIEPKDELQVLLRSRKELIREQLRIHHNDKKRASAPAPESPRTLPSTVKGKGIIGREDTEIGFGDKISSNEVMEAIRGSECLPFQVTESLGSKSSDGGVSLREILRPGNNKMNKVESLGLFRQIVELVDFAHSQDVVLLDLRPSCLYLHPSNKVRYIGSSTKIHFSTALARDSRRKLPYDHAGGSSSSLPISTCSTLSRNDYSSEATPLLGQSQFNSPVLQSEQRWYTCPKEIGGVSCSIASNIFSLGVLLFELICHFESLEAQCAGMLCLSDRIMPPKFLAENPMEAGFCLWLLHPDLASRPTTREILQSEPLLNPHEPKLRDVSGISVEENEAESELLLHFLGSLKAQKTKHASKLANDIGIIEADLKEIHKRFRPNTSSYLTNVPRSGTMSTRKLIQLEEAYFAARSQPQNKRNSSQGVPPRTRDRGILLRNETDRPNSGDDASGSDFGAFLNGLCKFARYDKIEERGSLRSRDLLGSSKVIRSIDLSRDEDYVATAGVSKKIKIYGIAALLDGTIDIHYPVVEMSNDSKLSCICWNRHIRNYIASTDYDGIVQIWDMNTGQGLRQYAEHQKRAWAVDFCQADPTKFASSSDDCCIKLWQLNERNSVSTIWNPANVCCIQFSPHSAHLLAFGCADNNIYYYDIRQTSTPSSTLSGHGKTVSYVKFLDSDSMISASTDNTLKLWNLKQKGSTGSSADACALTFRGHTNEKNFVGLSVWDGYIACGSETNEVFTYYKSMSAPVSSHLFGSSDNFAGSDNGNEGGHFVSSVCWGQKQGMLIAANSTGNLKILQMV